MSKIGFDEFQDESVFKNFKYFYISKIRQIFEWTVY